MLLISHWWSVIHSNCILITCMADFAFIYWGEIGCWPVADLGKIGKLHQPLLFQTRKGPPSLCAPVPSRKGPSVLSTSRCGTLITGKHSHISHLTLSCSSMLFVQHSHRNCWHCYAVSVCKWNTVLLSISNSLLKMINIVVFGFVWYINNNLHLIRKYTRGILVGDILN